MTSRCSGDNGIHALPARRSMPRAVSKYLEFLSDGMSLEANAAIVVEGAVIRRRF